MTRRAKERRMERVQGKLLAEEERRARARRLSARPAWMQLLLAIDGPPSVSSIQLSSDNALQPPEEDEKQQATAIVNELQWKSTQVPIAAAGGFQLPIKLDAAKGELHYAFSTRDYDVDFGVQMVCADGSMIQLVESRRYESQKQQVQGRLQLVGPGMVLLVWDNSFSWLNTKQLAYSVELKQETPPVSDAEKTQLALKARLERERELLWREQELDSLQAQVQTEDHTINFLRHQIEELQEKLRQQEEAKEATSKAKDRAEGLVEDLCWELNALNWRCLDRSALHRILSFLGEKDRVAWGLTTKRWLHHMRDFKAVSEDDASHGKHAAPSK